MPRALKSPPKFLHRALPINIQNANGDQRHARILYPVFFFMRKDGRQLNQLRPTKITPDYLLTAEGSVLIEVGHTRVLCAATVEDSIPAFLRGTGKGWVTAEYSMLPRATSTRTPRELTKGRPSGRTHEIQRLIGRSLPFSRRYAGTRRAQHHH